MVRMLDILAEYLQQRRFLFQVNNSYLHSLLSLGFNWYRKVVIDSTSNQMKQPKLAAELQTRWSGKQFFKHSENNFLSMFLSLFDDMIKSCICK